MKTASSWFRATAVTLLLAMATAPGALAQARKGRPPAAKAPAARSAPRPAVAVAPPSRATPPPRRSPMPSPDHTPPNGSEIPSPSHESLVSSLHSAMSPLARAGHDYNGRRGRAMQEVQAAIRLLASPAGAGPARPALASGPDASTPPGTGPRGTRADADARLREAQQSLQDIESRMNTNGVNPHHFTRARASVRNAIRELNLALIDL